jgi:hypothetical protein
MFFPAEAACGGGNLRRAEQDRRVWDFLLGIRAASVSPDWDREIGKFPEVYEVADRADLLEQFMACVNRKDPRTTIGESLWWRRVLSEAIQSVRHGEGLAPSLVSIVTKDSNHVPLTPEEEQRLHKYLFAIARARRVTFPDQLPTDRPEQSTDSRRHMVFGAAIVHLYTSGALKRADHCAAERCSNFFVGEHASDRYCSEDCRKSARKPDRRKRAIYQRKYRQLPQVKMRVTTRKTRSRKNTNSRSRTR